MGGNTDTASMKQPALSPRTQFAAISVLQPVGPSAVYLSASVSKMQLYQSISVKFLSNKINYP